MSEMQFPDRRGFEDLTDEEKDKAIEKLEHGIQHREILKLCGWTEREAMFLHCFFSDGQATKEEILAELRILETESRKESAPEEDNKAFLGDIESIRRKIAGSTNN